MEEEEEEEEEEVEYRICNVCGEEKSLSEFYQDKTKKLGRRTNCKKCTARQVKKYYQENKQRIIIRNVRYSKEHKEERNERSRRYYNDRRGDEIKRSRRYYNEHKDKEKERKEKYSATHKGVISIRHKLYYMRHKDKICRYGKKYRQTKTGRFVQILKTNRRRAMERASKADLTPVQWHRILEKQKYKCNLCHKKFSKSRKPTIDHIVPLSKGGDLTSNNVQALCRSCNSHKGVKVLKSFIISWSDI